MCICIYVYMYVYIYIYICTHIFTHTTGRLALGVAVGRGEEWSSIAVARGEPGAARSTLRSSNIV